MARDVIFRLKVEDDPKNKSAFAHFSAEITRLQKLMDGALNGRGRGGGVSGPVGGGAKGGPSDDLKERVKLAGQLLNSQIKDAAILAARQKKDADADHQYRIKLAGQLLNQQIKNSDRLARENERNARRTVVETRRHERLELLAERRKDAAFNRIARGGIGAIGSLGGFIGGDTGSSLANVALGGHTALQTYETGKGFLGGIGAYRNPALRAGSNRAVSAGLHTITGGLFGALPGAVAAGGMAGGGAVGGTGAALGGAASAAGTGVVGTAAATLAAGVMAVVGTLAALGSAFVTAKEVFKHGLGGGADTGGDPSYGRGFVDRTATMEARGLGFLAGTSAGKLLGMGGTAFGGLAESGKSLKGQVARGVGADPSWLHSMTGGILGTAGLGDKKYRNAAAVYNTKNELVGGAKFDIGKRLELENQRRSEFTNASQALAQDFRPSKNWAAPSFAGIGGFKTAAELGKGLLGSSSLFSKERIGATEERLGGLRQSQMRSDFESRLGIQSARHGRPELDRKMASAASNLRRIDATGANEKDPARIAAAERVKNIQGQILDKVREEQRISMQAGQSRLSNAKEEYEIKKQMADEAKRGLKSDVMKFALESPEEREHIRGISQKIQRKEPLSREEIQRIQGYSSFSEEAQKQAERIAYDELGAGGVFGTARKESGRLDVSAEEARKKAQAAEKQVGQQGMADTVLKSDEALSQVVLKNYTALLKSIEEKEQRLRTELQGEFETKLAAFANKRGLPGR